MRKTFVLLGLSIGSVLGGYIPTFFGVSSFSLISILTSTVGGILGIYVTYKITEGMD